MPDWTEEEAADFGPLRADPARGREREADLTAPLEATPVRHREGAERSSAERTFVGPRPRDPTATGSRWKAGGTVDPILRCQTQSYIV